MPALPKPSRGQALRAKHAAKIAEARELAALYRSVYKRDQYRCVVCHRSVVVGAVDHADVGDRTLVIRGNADLGVEIRREGVA